MLRLLLAPILLAAAPAPPGPAAPTAVRVRLDTLAGPITLAIDVKHAPRTAANFLQYVDDGRLDGTSFYRAARATGRAGGFVEGGIGTDPRRVLPPVPLEPTSRTGLRHTDGAISMARFAAPDSATANFSILAGANASLDANGRDQGYAVFGHVVDGMAIVRRILALPTAGRGDAVAAQTLLRPVRIVRAARLDGQARPSGRVKPWLLGF